MKILLSAYDHRAQYSYYLAEYVFGALRSVCAIDPFTVFINVVDWALPPAHSAAHASQPLAPQ
jgi:hypothetical protein